MPKTAIPAEFPDDQGPETRGDDIDWSDSFFDDGETWPHGLLADEDPAPPTAKGATKPRQPSGWPYDPEGTTDYDDEADVDDPSTDEQVDDSEGSDSADGRAVDTTTEDTDAGLVGPFVGDAGQATVEYALVLLGAALVALVLIGWATVGGGAARIGQFLGHVFDVIERKVV